MYRKTSKENVMIVLRRTQIQFQGCAVRFAHISHGNNNDVAACCPEVNFNFLAYLSPILMVGFQWFTAWGISIEGARYMFMIT